MVNLTQQQLAEIIDDERRESNAAFAGAARILRYMNRAVREIIKKPGVRTVKDTTTINFTGAGEYTLPADCISVISLYSGTPGSGNEVEFTYVPHDEMNLAMTGYGYTFKSPGKIYIFAASAQNLPSSSIVLDYWSSNIVLDVDGVTKKYAFVNPGDKSRLRGMHDDLFIDYTVSKILQREGKDEWKDRYAMFTSGLDSLTADGNQPNPPRKRRTWGRN